MVPHDVEEEPMRWEDERWVGFVKEDTAEWLDLSFDAKLIYPQLLRLVDGAGRRGLSGRGVDAIMRMLRCMTDEVVWVENALRDLERDFISIGDDLTIRGFLHGPKLPQSGYVRLYTRDTIAWSKLSCRARGTFCLLLRAVERAGILELESFGTDGVATLLRGPQDVVAQALSELVTDKCIAIDKRNERLLIPNYIDAQETQASDAARKRAQREWARDSARALVVEDTSGPAMSRDVPRCPSMLSDLADLTKPDPTGEVDQDPVRSRGVVSQGPRLPSGRPEDPVLGEVYDALCTASGGVLRSIATPDLCQKIARHSQAGAYMGRAPLEDVLAAVRRAADKEDTCRATGDLPRGKGALGMLVMAFVQNAKRGDALKLEIGSDAAAAVFEVFDPLWCKKHRAASRARGQGDDWAAAHIAKESKAHAKRVGAQDWKHVLAAAAATYLATDDRWLENQKHPLAQFSKNLPAYLEHEQPKPKREAKPPQALPLSDAEKAMNARNAQDAYDAAMRLPPEARPRPSDRSAPVPRIPARAPVSDPKTDVGAQGTHRAQEGASPGQERASSDLRSGTLERGPYAPDPEAGPPKGVTQIGNVVELHMRRMRGGGR